MTVPSAATATKFTELLIRKNATERRAITSPGMPLRASAHAPSARPPAPLAGTIEPVPSSDHASSDAVRHDIRLQKIGRNIATNERQEQSSSPAASESQPGFAF